MGKPKPPQSPLFSRGKIVYDWKAYFYSFCQVHGEPVKYKGKLLFRDGWSYSSMAYEGPEYAPPTDNNELDLLILEYWKLRYAALTQQILKLQHERKKLQEFASTKSLRLQQVTTTVDEEGKRHKVPQDVNTDVFDLKIKWLQDDLRECVDRLKEIEEYHKRKESA